MVTLWEITIGTVLSRDQIFCGVRARGTDRSVGKRVFEKERGQPCPQVPRRPAFRADKAVRAPDEHSGSHYRMRLSLTGMQSNW